NTTHQERYAWFRKQKIYTNYVLDMDVAEHYGVKDEMLSMTELPEWKAILVDFKEDTHPALLLEVMATLEVQSFDLPSTRNISFIAGGVAFHLSADEISQHLGIDDIQNLDEERM
ncbi:hypothetical protein, partial [Escherichia coli]|uniref:hypothetical protein n=1 Tax=Escherichia coli TaxID=562 RepID=UPI0032DA0CE0